MPLAGQVPNAASNPAAVLVPDPAARLLNGDLEDVKGDRFARFSFQDEPGKRTIASQQNWSVML